MSGTTQFRALWGFISISQSSSKIDNRDVFQIHKVFIISLLTERSHIVLPCMWPSTFEGFLSSKFTLPISSSKRSCWEEERQEIKAGLNVSPFFHQIQNIVYMIKILWMICQCEQCQSIFDLMIQRELLDCRIKRVGRRVEGWNGVVRLEITEGIHFKDIQFRFIMIN